MNSQFVKIGLHIVNLATVAAAHWEGSTLFIHFSGDRFLSFKGDDAQLIWSAISGPAVDLRTGEVKE